MFANRGGFGFLVEFRLANCDAGLISNRLRQFNIRGIPGSRLPGGGKRERTEQFIATPDADIHNRFDAEFL